LIGRRGNNAAFAQTTAADAANPLWGGTNMEKRRFRRPESIEAERKTRKMLRGFLEARGFKYVTSNPDRQGQTIGATSPEGEHLVMRVRLCWNRGADHRVLKRFRRYSAAQFMSKIKNGDWEGTIEEKLKREKTHGVTHLLFVQRDDDDIRYAALVPLSEFLPIWIEQRDISKRLIKAGRLGRRKKNHAANGSSPMIWLQDDRGAQEVAAALWDHPGIRDLALLEPSSSRRLPDHEAHKLENGSVPAFDPQEDDLRAVIQRQIKERRGQQKFRDSLRKRYRGRCLVTGCGLLDVLEAAHIMPYRGETFNHPENGLLLRADIHTLFDLDLLGIEPTELRIELHTKLATDSHYRNLVGKKLNCAATARPSLRALQSRYKKFQRLTG
jgi:5-methylcytosine-specific restriction enzyme A